MIRFEFTSEDKDLVVAVGRSPKPRRLDGDTTIIWRGQEVELANLQIIVDPFAPTTLFVVDLFEIPSRSITVDPDLVDALSREGFRVSVRHTDMLSDDVLDEAIAVFIRATGVIPDRFVCHPTFAAKIREAGFDAVVAEQAPSGYLYPEADGIVREGEALSVVSDGTKQWVEASAPHPAAPWRFVCDFPSSEPAPAAGRRAITFDDLPKPQ